MADATWDFVPGVGFVNKATGETVPVVKAVPIARAKKGDVVKLPPAPPDPPLDNVDLKKLFASYQTRFRGDEKTPPFDGELKPPGHSDWQPIPFASAHKAELTDAEEEDQRARCFTSFVPEASSPCLICQTLHARRCTPGVDPRGYMEPIGPPRPPGRVLPGKDPSQYPPTVPSPVAAFLAETAEGRDAAAAMKDIAQAPLAGECGIPDLQETPYFFRRMWVLQLEFCYKHSPASIHSWKMWFDDAVADLQQDRPRMKAEQDAYEAGIGVLCWETDHAARPASVDGRKIEIYRYDWPGGKPKDAPPLFVPKPRAAAKTYPRPFGDVPPQGYGKPIPAAPVKTSNDLFGAAEHPPAARPNRRY